MLSLTALGLIASGLSSGFLAVSDQLPPHDVARLDVTEHHLGAVADGRLVHVMAYDRAAFGGTILAIGMLHLWSIRSSGPSAGADPGGAPLPVHLTGR